MQHITIITMTISREALQRKRHQELVAWRCLAAITTLWLVASLWAFVASADRAAELASRI